MRIPATLRKYFPHEQDGSNRKKVRYKTRLAASLNTDSLELAEVRSGPIVAQFKAMIMAAKDQERPNQDFDFDKAFAKATATFEAYGSNQLGAAKVAMQLDPDEAKSPGELKERKEVYAAVTKKGVSTKAYVDEWQKQCGYREKNADEAERFLKTHFCPKFPIFELNKPMDLRLWVEDQLQGRNGYKVASRETVKKKVGWINSYWGYCEGQYTEAPYLTYSSIPKAKKTKSSAVQKSYHPYTMDEYYQLLEQTDKQNRGRVDPVMKDLIIVAAHTGCRLNEFM